MTKRKYPEFDLGLKMWAEDQMYAVGANAYAVEDLWEAAKNLPVYEVPLIGFQTDIALWDGLGEDFMDFTKHAALVMNADLDYPIILDVHGGIADGRHRLAKAIALGHSTIKVQRLAIMPEPTYVFDEE